ncbi:hypothetical protein C9374_011070 [Naegleria lovaniensis]|uniref:VWFA domain-containing protein n=1 Tax=Naegleria lovaniensis TaxID=51637 RepID=A0AA88GG26_NAELO|nr:uncharacterized protein C9374_011070 [Naegleria lovaniensis]KAG2374233.1 hypothetical protein C9374_011070 [Naegleria lovaniensis]
MPTGQIVSSSTSKLEGFTINPSLIKTSTLVQTILGLFIGGVVIASVVATVILVSVGVGYQAPTPKPDFAETFKRTPITINVLMNDVDPRGGNLTVQSIKTSPLNGSVKIVSSSSVVYQSNGTFSGNDSFVYVVSNGYLQAEALVTIHVLNRPPHAIPLEFQVEKNSKPIELNFLTYVNENGGSIYDLDSFDLLTITDVSGGVLQPSDTLKNVSSDILQLGSVKRLSSGISYSPTKYFIGTESYNYTVSDGVATSSSTLKIVVTNGAPVAKDDAYYVPKYMSASLNVLSNDNDPNEDPITIESVTSVGVASASIEQPEKKTIRYLTSSTVSTSYSDSFEYIITDGEKSSSAVVFIKVFNSPPLINDFSTTVKKNSVNNLIPVNYTESDILDSVVMSSITPSPSVIGSSLITSKSSSMIRAPCCDWRSVVRNDYTIQFNPLANQIYTQNFQIVMEDGESKSRTATYSIQVVNDPPTANPDGTYCIKNSVAILNVIANDVDVNPGDTAQIRLSTGWTKTSSNGGSLIPLNATHVRYTAPIGFTGDDTISYEITDQTMNQATNQWDASSFATGTILVHVVPENYTNQAPTCSGGISHTLLKGASYDFKSKMAAVSTDPEGKTLTYSITNAGALSSIGSVTGATTFKAAQKNSGTQVAAFTVSDIYGLTAQCPLTVTVQNTAPVARDASYTFVISQSNLVHTISYLADGYASDADAQDVLSLSIVSSTNCLSTIASSVTISGNVISLTRKVTSGSCVLTVKVTDDDGTNPLSSNNAAITINLSSLNPIARNDAFSIDQGQTIRIPVTKILQNDTDEYGLNGMSFVSVQCPDASYCHRVPRVINVNGETFVEVDSDQNSCQADKFQYTARTASGTTRNADVFIEFKNCICKSKIDFMFVIDASGSIGTTNFEKIRTLGPQIVSRMQLGEDAIKVGIARFHDSSTLALPLTTSLTSIKNTFANMPYEAGWTAQLAGIREAFNELARNGRTDAEKVMYILTDGLANKPCSCNECSNFWGQKPSLYPYTVQKLIIENTKLSESQKQQEYKNRCNYQLPYTPGDPNNFPFYTYTCSQCSWDDYSSSCLPCADAVPIAQKINSWKRNATGIVPPDLDNPFNGYNIQWKIIAMGVGEALSNPLGSRELRGMNYNADKTINVPWDDLQKTYSEIVDQTCNSRVIELD